MNFYHTLLEQYTLLESLNSVIAANPHIPESIIRGYYTNALPDNNKNDRLLNHVLKLHNNGNITPDSAHLLKPHLTALSNTSQLHQLRNLNTFDDHINATKGIEDKSITKKERVDVNTPTVFENEHVIVKQHLTHESAERAARMHPENPMYNVPKEKGKAQWCVSLGGKNGEAHFNHYTENGNLPMYTIFNKKTKRIHALVANPSDTRDTVELRDENDKQPYTVNDDLKSFIANHPGIEHTPVGVHLRRLTDEHMQEEDEKVSAAMHNKDKLHSALFDNDISEPKRTSLLRSPYITEEHIREMISSPNIPVRLKVNAIRNKLSDKFTMKDIKAHSKPLMDILTNPSANERLKRNIAMSPRLSQEHADYIMYGNDDVSKGILMTHNAEYLTPNHVNHIMNDGIHRLKYRMMNDFDQHVTPQHIHNIIMEPHSNDENERNNQEQLTKIALEKYPHYVTPDHINHIMDVGDVNEKTSAVSSDAFNIHHLYKALNQIPKVSHAAFNKSITQLTPEHADKIMGSNDTYLKSKLIEERPDLISSVHIENHINDLIANFSPDKNRVFDAVINHTPHLMIPEHINTILNANNNYLKTKVLNTLHNKITTEHIKNILDTDKGNLRDIALDKYSHLMPSAS